MKKLTKILSLILIVTMSLSVVEIYANNIVLGEEYILEDVSADYGVEEDIFEDDLMPMSATGCGMTSSQAKKAAAALGYTQVAGEYSHGQPVFYNSKNVPHYITADADGHIGGVWKGANSIADLGSKST